MEILIFWLVPVVLLIVLLLLILHQTQNHKRRLVFIEPLGSLIRGWHLARVKAGEREAKEALLWIERSSLDQDLLGTILKNLSDLPPITKQTEINLIHNESIGALSNQIVLEVNGKILSFVVGLARDLAPRLDAVKEEQFVEEQEQAGRHGYLLLVIGRTVIHRKQISSSRLSQVKHAYLATVLLEPELDQHFRRKLSYSRRKIKFLTALPTSLSQNLYAKTFGDENTFSLSAAQINSIESPSFAEADIKKASIIGEANIKLKNWVIRVHRDEYNCEVASSTDTDQLPARIFS